MKAFNSPGSRELLANQFAQAFSDEPDVEGQEFVSVILQRRRKGRKRFSDPTSDAVFAIWLRGRDLNPRLLGYE
jgi:hypothetical protein